MKHFWVSRGALKFTLESVEAGDLQEAVKSAAEKIVDSIKDRLDTGFEAVSDLKESVQACWNNEFNTLPEELRDATGIAEYFESASEVLGEVGTWVQENPEKCEAAAKLLVLLLVGFKDPDTLAIYFESNPGAIGELFESLSLLAC